MRKLLQLSSVVLVLFLLNFQGKAQDKILTMSGKVIPCKIVEDSLIVVKYEVTNKRNKIKERFLHKSEIFSIIKSGEETVLYAPDELLGDTFSVEETRVFIIGEGDGENYNTRRIEALGYVLGAGLGYVSKANVLILLVTPTVYTLYQYIPYIKIKEETMSDLKFKGNDLYLQGYELTARSKRLRKAIKSSIIGSVVGAVIFRVIPFS